MSNDFYFRKWKTTLAKLESIVNLDILYQTSKLHDKNLCDAVRRLTEILVKYMAIYNQVLDCLEQNLQVQKTKFIEEVIKTILSRILELRRDLRHLEVSNYHFLSNALINSKLTINDAELSFMPFKCERNEYIQKALDEAINNAREKTAQLIHDEVQDNTDKAKEKVSNWWDMDYSGSNSTEIDINDEEETIISEDSQQRKNMINLIKTHEKSRQTVFILIQHKQKRERWEKALTGNLKPEAPFKMKEKAARLIQFVIRTYFQSKRQKLKQSKRDEFLGITMLKEPYNEVLNKAAEIGKRRLELKKEYNEHWESSYEKMKEEFSKRRICDITEDYRDFIRGWFREWFDQIQYFHDVPNTKVGGSALIIKEEISLPIEWLEEYEKYIASKLANKGKTSQEMKFEKMSIKREEMRLNKQMIRQKKIEDRLLQKMMKNPDMHPGYDYPESKTTNHILQAINNYNYIWRDLDQTNAEDVKGKSVKAMDLNNAYTEVKLQAVVIADKDMRLELKKLKTALKEDYSRNGEKMLEPMPVNKRKGKKNAKIKTTINKDIVKQLEDLAIKGFLKVCPKTKLQDFDGDPNFSGEEIRCNFESAYPFNAETRDLCWEVCKDMTHGFRSILLIGPKASGKTTLVNALANTNNAILFELNISLIPKDMIIAPYLELITNSVITCARALQPSVIHLKHIQRLLYIKVPPMETEYNLNIVNTFWIKRLFRKIHKTDKITVIGTCIDPWLAKSKPLLARFPTSILLPNTSYSTTVRILKNWVIEHPAIPADFDVQSLANVLQGYSFGYLKKSLKLFMSPERIVKTAVSGLSPEEVYDYILEDQTEERIDYEKYRKWYTEKTYWGRKEQKHIEEQREFKRVIQDLAEKARKKKRPVSSASSSSHTLN